MFYISVIERFDCCQSCDVCTRARSTFFRRFESDGRSSLCIRPLVATVYAFGKSTPRAGSQPCLLAEDQIARWSCLEGILLHCFAYLCVLIFRDRSSWDHHGSSTNIRVSSEEKSTADDTAYCWTSAGWCAGEGKGMEQQFFHHFDRTFVFFVTRLILWIVIRLSESLRLHQLQNPALASWQNTE